MAKGKGRQAPPAPETPRITIDLARLFLPDLRLVHRIRAGKASDEETLALLERVVVGGIEQVPVTAFADVLAALFRAVFGAANPEADEKN